MKSLLAILASLIISFSLLSGEASRHVADPIISDKSFSEALTYSFSASLYWNSEVLMTPLFKEWGLEKEYIMNPSMLEKTVSGKLTKRGKNTYCLDLGNELPSAFRCLELTRMQNGEWGLADQSIEDSNALETTISENYEFEIPVDFMSRAAKFDDGAKPILKALEVALGNVVSQIKDAPAGENHIYVGPFRSSMFPGDLYIYWVEKKERLIPTPIRSISELEKWDAADFTEASLDYSETGMFLPDKSLPDSPTVQLNKRIITTRLFDSNAVVANCVRDGKLITVTKRPPSQWSKFKAWLKAKVERTPKKVD